MCLRYVLLVGILLLPYGCGMDPQEDAFDEGAVPAAESTNAFAAGSASATQTTSALDAVVQPAAARKIIYEADVRLVVEDFTVVERAIPRIVQKHEGYLADVTIDRYAGEEREGRWQARIPVGRFDAFLDEITELGVPLSRRQTAQEVTDEFVDLEARIASKKQLEQRILELLNKTNGQIKEIIEVEHELARVRGEVEQMEGRLRYLANRTDLTTVSISAREEKDFVPPQTPTLANRVGAAWSVSLSSLNRVGEQLLISLVYAGPWLIAMVTLLVPVVWCLARAYRRATS